MRMRLPRPARVVFVTALVSGVAMIAASVNGILGIDRELSRSAQAAQPAPITHDVKIRDTYCTHPARRA
jgi:hypothetical protein